MCKGPEVGQPELRAPVMGTWVHRGTPAHPAGECGLSLKEAAHCSDVGRAHGRWLCNLKALPATVQTTGLGERREAGVGLVVADFISPAGLPYDRSHPAVAQKDTNLWFQVGAWGFLTSHSISLSSHVFL